MVRDFNFWEYVEVVNNRQKMYPYGDEMRFSREGSCINIACAHCGASPTNKVVETYNEHFRGQIAIVTICPACYRPTLVWKDDQGDRHIAPRSMPKEPAIGTPDHIADVWKEGERCYGAKAYNAAALMYRKLIFLVAVDRKLPEKSENGRAPNFRQCLEYLNNEDYINKREEKVLGELIREVGNSATHEIEPLGEEEVKVARKFSYKMLESVYEDSVEANKVLNSIRNNNTVF